MTSKDFRRIALGLPEAIESEHMNHPDFRVHGKIFATLYPDETSGVVMLTPEQQLEFVERAPTTFVPAKGAWGRRGSTQVLLKSVNASDLRNAITCAWLNKATKKLAVKLDGGKAR